MPKSLQLITNGGNRCSKILLYVNVVNELQKIVNTGHKIIIDDPITTVVNKLMNKVVMEVELINTQAIGMNIGIDQPCINIRNIRTSNN